MEIEKNCYHCSPDDGKETLHVCDSCREKFQSGELRAYTDEYTGPKWQYGYINRPFGLSCQPKGFVLISYEPGIRVEIGGNRSRHGVIDYPFPLTDDEMYSFELFLTGVYR